MTANIETNKQKPWEAWAELVSRNLGHQGEQEIVTKKHENTSEGDALFEAFRKKLGWDDGDSNG